MMRKLNWEASTSHERMSAIDEIKQSIIRCNGYIINFNMYSDLALSLSIEIEEKHIIKLHNSFQEITTISDLDSSDLSHESNQEWMILVNVSFSKGTGNMKHEKPMVDG